MPHEARASKCATRISTLYSRIVYSTDLLVSAHLNLISDLSYLFQGLRPTAGRRPREAVVVVVVVVVTAVVLFLLLSWSLLQVWTLYVLLLLQDWVLVPLLTFVTLLTPRIDGEAVGF